MFLGTLYNFEVLHSKNCYFAYLDNFRNLRKKKNKIKVHFYFFEISQCDRRIVSLIGNYPKVRGFDL